MINKITTLVVMLACALVMQAGDNPVVRTEVDNAGVVRKIHHDTKTVYLVFTGHFSLNDAGYFENFDGIEPVLNTLKEKGVKGSFFPTAVTLVLPRYEKSVRRIIDEGHYLSAHSYAHLLLCDNTGTLVTRDSVNVDLKMMEFQLERFGLKKSDYDKMIPPYETYNEETAQWYRDKGYKLLNPTAGFKNDLDWTEPGTKNYVSTEEILKVLWEQEAQGNLDGAILLIHAMNYPWRTPEDRPYNHLGEIIDLLKAKGYTFGCIKDIDL